MRRPLWVAGLGLGTAVAALASFFPGTAYDVSADATLTSPTYSLPHVLVRFEPGDLAEPERTAFAALADQGVRDVLDYLGPGVAARQGARPVRFRVTRRVPFSMTRGGTVYLPTERVRTRSAPYLHETTHVLLPGADDDATWLSEGFASFVESHVAEHMGGYDGHVFTRSGNRGVDREAAEHLRTAGGREVLSWIGTPGEPPGLYRERWRVAPPYYVLSQSFTKFLVERAGLPTVVALFDEDDVGAALARRTGRTTDDWRREWLARLPQG